MADASGAMAADGITVSVVIAAYHVGTCIAHAIASIDEPAGFPIEIIVVDDGSLDDTRAVVAALAARDGRIRLEALPANAGPSAARNRGIAVARGRWIAVLDADDAYRPGRLSRLVALAEAAGADIVADNFAMVHPGDPAEPGPALATEPAGQWLDAAAFLGGARPGLADADLGLLKPVFRAAFLREHRLRYPEDIRHGEDFELILAALAQGARYRLNRQGVGYLYTARTSGLSRTVVDYSRQIARCGTLARSEAIRGDAALVRLLGERADALRELELVKMSYGTGRSPVAPAVLRHALRSAAGRAWVFQRIKNRVCR